MRNMVDKISIRITGIEEEWEELQKYIVGTRSEFLRKCIVDKVKRRDELTELVNELKEKQLIAELASDDVRVTEEKIAHLKKQQSINAKNEVLIQELLETCRKVAHNEGLTEKRVMAIADDKIDYRILMGKLRDEGIKFSNDEKIEKRIVQSKDGESVEVKTYTRPEKSSFEILKSIFQRDYNSRGYKKDPINFLEENKDRYTKMCSNYDNLSYPSFKKKLKEIYKR